MNITIDKKNGIPLYIQVKKQIMHLIKDGTLRVGSKMPTERELSQELVVSRNTISAAYNELEAKGVLKSIRGKGTFVAEEVVSWQSYDSRRKINKFVDLALEEALECGIDPDDFLDIVTNRVSEKKDVMNKVTSAFVE
ncbi:MAG TPA: GntR family transcriptional regulator, partial [Clostridium sp.]|nr:GntR family transcriptional regulator [Clostridium sp.]